MSYRSGTIQIILMMAVFLATAGIYFQSSADPNELKTKGQRNHENASCSVCHSNFTGEETETLKVQKNDYCLTCHRESELMSGNYFHENNTNRCLDCHSFHETTRITAAGKSFTYQYNNEKLKQNCLACHNGPYSTVLLSEGHQQAKEVFHRNASIVLSLTLSDNCLLCHSQNTSINIPSGELTIESPRFNLHASHPMDVQPNTTSGNNHKEIISQINCVSCHNLTDQIEVADAGNTNYDYNSCISCHEDKQFNAYMLAKQ